jgi:hypothetical protein
MKKRISLLLSIIIFIGLFQGMYVYANDTSFRDAHGYVQVNQRIDEVPGQGLDGTQSISAGAEEAAFKWNMMLGTYNLTYNIISSADGSTNQVKLTFNVDTEKAELKAMLLDQNGDQIKPVTFKYAPPPYTGTKTSEKKDEFSYTFKLNNTGTVAAADRQLSFEANNTKIRMIIENGILHLWTDSVAEGNITDFTLTHSGNAGQSYTYSILNGLKAFDITPTHLVTTGSVFDSKNIIKEIDNIEAGSKSGVKVSFDMPKKVKANAFQYIMAESDETVTLEIWQEQRPGVNYNGVNNGIALSFKPVNGSAVFRDGVAIGKVEVENNKVNLYISRERPEEDTTKKVIIWETLEESMLVSAQLTLRGGEFKDLQWTKNEFLVEKNGYTYLKYKMDRYSESQIRIDIVPYNIEGTVNYTIRREAAEGYEPDFESEGSPIINRVHIGTRENKGQVISIFIPKHFVNSYYQIEARTGDYKFVSQKLQFNADKQVAPPPITQIVRANNIYVVPGTTDTGEKTSEGIGLDIEWSAPDNEELLAMLAKGDIYYELTLYNTIKENPHVTKVFKVYKDGSEVKVEVYGGSTNSGYEEGRYNRSNNTFEVNRVIIQNAEQTMWEYLDLGTDRFKEKDYPEQSDLNNENVRKDGLNYSVPGVYYLSMKGILDTGESTEYEDTLAVSDESALAAISLDYATEVIPSASPIAHNNQSDTSVTPAKINYSVEIENVDIRNYVNNMLLPAKIYLDEDINSQYKGIYEVFLYQNPTNSNGKNISTADFEEAIEEKEPILLGGTKGNILDVTGYIDALREGEIVPIEYSVNPLRGNSQAEVLQFHNLDPNQVYYIKVRVRLEPFKLDASGNKVVPQLKYRYSIFSNTYSFTTTTVPQPPKPEDKIPPAPANFELYKQPNNTTAILKWAKADFEKDDGREQVYYELVRASDTQLNTSEKNSRTNLDEMIIANRKIVGFDTKESTIRKVTYNPATENIETYELSPQQSSTGFVLEDTSLSPNTIYYYYIRTACIIDGKTVRSEWIMVPVTTSPVERPTRLQVEVTDKYSYDPKKETVISFLAPIPEEAQVPDNYEFEIAVQGETDSTYRLDYRTVSLTSKEDSSILPTGTRHFVYKIKELKPGRRYDIKVRIVDKTKEKPEDGDYPKSLYSDRVAARTEFDQEDQDKDNKYAEYLKKYEDSVEKLRRQSYWQADGDSRHEGVYKYRNSYINAEMASRNIYELQADDALNRMTYYLPATMLEHASDLNVAISTTLGNESMHLRPYTLTSDNEAVKEAVAKLNSKSISDYYIKLEFSKMSSQGSINGETVLSPEIVVDLDIVYLEEEDIIIEDDIMIELNDLIDAERERVITLLERELDRGTISDERLDEIIEDAVNDIKSDHQKEVRSILRRETSRSSAVNEIEKPILISSVLDSYLVNGYYLEGSWTAVDVMQANGGFAIEGGKLGVYVFTGRSNINNTAPALSPYQNIISKYTLADFFTIDSYMIKTAATKKQVYGAVARILGAKRNVDYMEYLRLRGIKGITSIGMDKGIRQDEATYIIMQAYEKIYNKSVAAVNIKNRQSITNIGAFQAPYRSYVYAAVELKVVPAANAMVLPSKIMSAEEIIKMLSNVVPK